MQPSPVQLLKVVVIGNNDDHDIFVKKAYCAVNVYVATFMSSNEIAAMCSWHEWNIDYSAVVNLPTLVEMQHVQHLGIWARSRHLCL